MPDIEVLSNASSDDFCVVPLPACFDPDIPLDFEDFPPNFSVTTEVPLGSPVERQDDIEYEGQQSVSTKATS